VNIAYRPILEPLEDRCLLSGGFAQINLASDVPGLARVTDPNLVNPWGAAYSPTGPFWMADNGNGVSDLLDGRGQPVPLVVSIPDSTPTGTVFNGGSGFVIAENGRAAPSRFLFATEDGTISGWSAVVDPTHALLAVDGSSSGAIFTGLALASFAGHDFLYAADFHHGTIDVFDQAFRPVRLPGSFRDPNLPANYAPFNLKEIGNQLVVAFAQQDEDGEDDVAGAGHGAIDVFDTAGNLVRRFATGGPLDSPWGVALAPATFGPFGGTLLVGNEGDGHINAFDPASGKFLGALTDETGTPITIPTLWSLTFGNDHLGGAADVLFFTAGVDYDKHGLFGAIVSAQRTGRDTAGPGAFDPSAPGEAGDYPLPPSGGPALVGFGPGPPIPVADLLPLRESSLVLAPTLSLPAGGIEAPFPAARAGGQPFSGGPAMGASNDHGGPGWFLDRGLVRTVPAMDESSQAAAIPVFALVNGAGDEGLPAEALASNFAEQDTEALPPPAPEDAGRLLPEHGSRWTKMTELIVFISISVAGGGWLWKVRGGHRPSSSRSPSTRSRSGTAWIFRAVASASYSTRRKRTVSPSSKT
jgi:uncharacterized protein (TIGR03118 family)